MLRQWRGEDLLRVKGILRVRYVLEGSVQPGGAEVRVNAKLKRFCSEANEAGRLHRMPFPVKSLISRAGHRWTMSMHRSAAVEYASCRNARPQQAES